MKSSLLCFFPILALATAASANSFSDTWEGPAKLNLNLYVFAADVDGTLSKGQIGYDVNQPFKDTVKELDDSYMLHLDFNKGLWGAYVDNKLIKTSAAQQVYSVPVALKTSLEQTSFGLYYQAYVSESKIQNKSSGEKTSRARFIVEPTIGVHRTEVDATLSALNHSPETSAAWNEFFWGSRFKYNFDSAWNLAAEMSFGVEDTRSAQTYLGYRHTFFGRPVNFRVGYRYFEQNHHTNNFHWDIKQHGPVIGVSLPIL